jgi:LPS export ABC transporter protein LptC
MSNQLPDVIISHPFFTMTDAQGHKTLQFSSDTLWHYQADNHSDFTKPVGFYFPPNKGAWQVTADQGKAVDGDQTIYLLGNVWLNQKASRYNKDSTITTQAMSIYPTPKIAEGKLFVTIAQPGFKVTSIGFHADLAKNELKLLAQAKGYYSSASTTGTNQ